MTTGEQADACDLPGYHEIKTFFAAMAMALRETAVRFEETAARVTELAIMRGGRADRDLVVALQNFDRLQQEFATLAEVFALATAKSHESWLRTAGNGHPAEDAIARIAMADLKERLLRHLATAVSGYVTSPMGEEAIF